MYKLFPFLLLFAFLKTAAQSSDKPYHNAIKISYGFFYPSGKQYHNPIQSPFNQSFENPKAVIGLRLEHPRGVGRKNMNGEYYTNYFLNQAKNIGDSIHLNWFANNFGIILKYDIFPRSKVIDFSVGLGPVIGSQRLIVDDGSKKVYRNFNAALVPKIELRFQIGKRICIGGEGLYFYDISNSRWKGRSSDYVLDHSKFTGAVAHVYIGWCFDGFR